MMKLNFPMLILCLWAASYGAQGANDKPNVLFIAIDDMKPLLGCYGYQEIQSPNIDALAARGTTFLNAQCQFPVCGPSRASIMTGLRPETTGIMDLKTKMRDVTPDILTLPQHFKNEGYTTAGVGKIYDPRCVDSRMKCDEPSWSLPFVFAPKYSGEKVDHGEKVVALAPEVEDVAFPDHRICEKGIERMRELAQGDTPFFLAVGFKKPHLPFIAPKRFWDLYDPADIKLASLQEKVEGNSGYGYWNSNEFRGYKPSPAEGPIPEEQQRNAIHGYRACVSWVDSLVGKLTTELDALGLADNTLIVLWGDHGFHLGDHGLWGKHTPFEEAARSPLIIVDPRIASTGKTTETPAEFTDVFPTLCSLAGLPTPEVLQGVDLSPTLQDANVFSRQGAITIYKSRGAYGYSIRTPRYRYIEWISNKGKKLVGQDLFDFEKDPLGKKNWVTERPDIVKEMQALLHADTEGWDTLQQSLTQN